MKKYKYMVMIYSKQGISRIELDVDHIDDLYDLINNWCDNNNIKLIDYDAKQLY